MSLELNVRFPDPEHVIARLDEDETAQLTFENPITVKTLQDITWYIETYAAHSLGDPDDTEAARIEALLPTWGNALFNAVFASREAQRLFNAFQDAEDAEGRLLTISAEDPTILALPWELLHDPSTNGGFLFMENPRISIRRRVPGAGGGRKTFRPEPKAALRLLFVVSRPEGAGFLDPRADPQAVLAAVEEFAPGRVQCEFLRPPTLDALVDRLEDPDKPSVDVLHFDGHGVFDRNGGILDRAKKARISHVSNGEEVARERGLGAAEEGPPNTGYLLFEDSAGGMDLVSAAKLGDNLNRRKVALVILSACQSAAIGSKAAEASDDPQRPMSGVAERLTRTGIPSVLAMTHSVLVPTTRKLFGEFYKDLARHRAIGESLDNARRQLLNHPEKYEVQRGQNRDWLKLYDWFLPALYQQGIDGPLLQKPKLGSQSPDSTTPKTNLPEQPESGFFGRKRALWDIERWFAGATKRITITGFGGQGKTALAQEVGRWLTRTGMFQAAVFVDYSKIQAIDAVAVAVSNIGSVHGETLIDADAATQVLKQAPTLVILDNLESLAPESLAALLDAAVPWSLANGSRLLCTTRQPKFDHPAYKTEGTEIHRRIQLDGLGSKQSPDEALEWCAALMRLPPEPTVLAPSREAIIELFDQVKFHPLSIRVLAQQLKSRRPADLGERLADLLAGTGLVTKSEDVSEDRPAALLASLELSLDKLTEPARQALPRLGVFQGGAMENQILAICEPPGNSGSNFAGIWPDLRRQLETGALIEAENIPNVTFPFLRFHPTLAPMLWAKLDPEERDWLSRVHQRRYYDVVNSLDHEDVQNPRQARAIAWRELANLLHAVHSALDAGEPDAGDFADLVGRFLALFSLRQEAERLSAKARASVTEVGSNPWYLALSNRGEQLLADGRVAEASQIFQAILEQQGSTPTFERAATLARLGRCFRAGARPDLAVQRAEEGIAVCDSIGATDGVKRQRGLLLTDMADALMQQGKFVEARQAFEKSLRAKREMGGDVRGEGIVLAQLGTLAMKEGDLKLAGDRYHEALALFQTLREPATEALVWHQLGSLYNEARQWDEAERHYRESARISEEAGDLATAAQTWNQLATVSMSGGRVAAAEEWYGKSIAGFREAGDRLLLSMAVQNLANLLLQLPGRLEEAGQLAAEALNIKRHLDPGAAQIWNTYMILAQIVDKETQAEADAGRQLVLQNQARDYRRLAREAKRNFAGTRHELRRDANLIVRMVVATQDSGQRQMLEQVLPNTGQPGYTNLIATLRRILTGERDADALCETLDLNDAMSIEAILQGIAEPASLADLMADAGQR